MNKNNNTEPENLLPDEKEFLELFRSVPEEHKTEALEMLCNAVITYENNESKTKALD